MSRPAVVWAIVAGLALGAYVGVVAKKKLDHAMYIDASVEEAADNLLDLAREQAGNDTKDQIRLAGVYYLSGRKEQGQAIIDSLTAETTDPLVWQGIGRLYYAAGEWDRAESVFQRVLAMEPRDPHLLAEIGSYYNLQGERERAEELFKRGFDIKASEFENTLNVAGSYAGIVPR